MVAALGTAQTLAWASTYDLPAMLAVPMAKDIGVSTPMVFAAFSMALIGWLFFKHLLQLRDIEIAKNRIIGQCLCKLFVFSIFIKTYFSKNVSRF